MSIDREEIVEILDFYRETIDTEATATAILDLLSKSYAEGYSFAKREIGLIDEAVEAL